MIGMLGKEECQLKMFRITHSARPYRGSRIFSAIRRVFYFPAKQVITRESGIFRVKELYLLGSSSIKRRHRYM